MTATLNQIGSNPPPAPRPTRWPRLRAFMHTVLGIAFVAFAGFATYAATNAYGARLADFKAVPIAAAGVIVGLYRSNRNQRRRNNALEERIEALSDQEWERHAADTANHAKNRFLAMA